MYSVTNDVSSGMSLIVFVKPASAETRGNTSLWIENLFEGLSDNKLVVVYPDGSISYTDNVYADYSTQELNQKAATIKTVSEAKEYLKGQFSDEPLNSNSATMERAALPHWNKKELRAGEHYRSQAFSGRGWRFSGYAFYPKYGTGGYLYYRSIGDDGRVGNFNDAMSTAVSGGNYGTPLYKREGWKAIWIGIDLTNGNNAKGYYTYNPISGSVYEVHN